MEDKKQHERVERLALLLLAAPDEQACAECLDALEPYIDAQLAGWPYTEQMPAVARHLDACVACADSYALLYDVRAAADSLPAPARIPAPDLSFLMPPAERLRAALAGALERAGLQLRLALSRSLIDTLPSPAPAPALRGASASPLLDLMIDEPAAAIPQLRLIAYPVAHEPERCDLRVQIALAGREWPDLGGVRVTLTFGDERRRAATDAWGEVVFAGLLVSALPVARVEVDADLGSVT